LITIDFVFAVILLFCTKHIFVRTLCNSICNVNLFSILNILQSLWLIIRVSRYIYLESLIIYNNKFKLDLRFIFIMIPFLNCMRFYKVKRYCKYYFFLHIPFQNALHLRLKCMPGRKPFPPQMFFSIQLILMSVSGRVMITLCVQLRPLTAGIIHVSYTGIPHFQTCRQYNILEIKYLKLRV